MRKNNLFQYFEHQDITSILIKFNNSTSNLAAMKSAVIPTS